MDGSDFGEVDRLCDGSKHYSDGLLMALKRDSGDSSGLPDAAPAPQPRGCVVFDLDRQRHALPLEAVARVLRVVEITPIQQAHPCLKGVVDIAGQIHPVVDSRRLLGATDRCIELSDQLLQVRLSWGDALLWVDAGADVVWFPGHATEYREEHDSVAPGTECLLNDLSGIVRFHQPERLLHWLRGAFCQASASHGLVV